MQRKEHSWTASYIVYKIINMHMYLSICLLCTYVSAHRHCVYRPCLQFLHIINHRSCGASLVPLCCPWPRKPSATAESCNRQLLLRAHPERALTRLHLPRGPRNGKKLALLKPVQGRARNSLDPEAHLLTMFCFCQNGGLWFQRFRLAAKAQN